MAVNSSDIAVELAEETGISKNMSKVYTERLFDIILKHLEENEEVNIKNFGKFEFGISAPRVGRNVHTGETIQIPAKHKIKFTMSRTLAEQYKSGKEI